MQNDTNDHKMSQTFETMRLDTCNSDEESSWEEVEPRRKKQKLDHFSCDTPFVVERDHGMEISNVTENDIKSHFSTSASTSVSSTTTVSCNYPLVKFNANDDSDCCCINEELPCELEVGIAAQCAMLDQVDADAYYDESLFESFFAQAIEELRFSQSFFENE
jgi:hypothetical protein